MVAAIHCHNSPPRKLSRKQTETKGKRLPLFSFFSASIDLIRHRIPTAAIAMGTELLRPQDCLMRAFKNPNTSRSWTKQSLPEPRKRREGSPKPAKGKHMVMGQVTILKRGESLDSAMTGRKKRESGTESWEVAVFGSARLGPDPDAIPKEVRLRPVRCGDTFAGVGFTLSPSPRALPLPSFSRRKKEVGVDDSKTRGLRRLLRLE